MIARGEEITIHSGLKVILWLVNFELIFEYSMCYVIGIHHE
jgi:hypothetical protein